jgi:hypothetical protein
VARRRQIRALPLIPAPPAPIKARLPATMRAEGAGPADREGTGFAQPIHNGRERWAQVGRPANITED